MQQKRWVRAEIDELAATALSQSAAIDERLARLLVGRGVTRPDEAKSFLNPQLSELPDPSLLKGLDRAVERLARAIHGGERIALYGDYDVDGVTSTTLLASFLKAHGVEPRIYIPKRLTEGYGLNSDAVETLAAEAIKILVTLDCGITAAKEIARANERGIECIVVDHHRCTPDLPEAFATLNTQQEDCAYPDKGLAAVGVCFNLVVGLRRALREAGHYKNAEEPNLRRYLDLVALGTIADMVPLSGTNRILAWHGIEELRAARRPGIRALMDVSRVRPARASSTDVGFRLGPRINAAGRLSDASCGVRLLLAADLATARPLADVLEAANRDRQQIEAQVFAGAVAQVEAMKSIPRALVLYDEAWHPGVVGIVASKIVERYERPTIIIGEAGRGSGRTTGGVHLYDAICDVSHHLSKFGGHRAAAGLTIASDRVEAFRRDFIQRVERDAGSDVSASALVYDEELDPTQFHAAFAASLERLEPFGNGNPQPLFMTSGVHVKTARLVGHDHLKLRLQEGGLGGIEAIAFKRGDMLGELVPGRRLEVAYHIEQTEFSGVEYVELRLRDLRALDAPVSP